MEKGRKNTLLLYLSLVGWMMIPTIYTTVRTAVAGSTGSSLDILGSLEWFDLIDETITAFLVVPLYYLLKSKEERKRNSGTAMLMSLIIYVIFIEIDWRLIPANSFAEYRRLFSYAENREFPHII